MRNTAVPQIKSNLGKRMLIINDKLFNALYLLADVVLLNSDAFRFGKQTAQEGVIMMQGGAEKLAVSLFGVLFALMNPPYNHRLYLVNQLAVAVIHQFKAGLRQSLL